MSAPRYYLSGNFAKFKSLFLQETSDTVHFSSGEIIVRPHTTWDKIYYLLSGEVKVSIVEEEMEKNLAYCGADYLIPFAISPQDPIQNLLQIEAVSDVEAVAIRQEHWDRLLTRTPQLLMEMHRMLLDYMYLLAHELESQTFDSGMEKVASFLYTVYENTGNKQIRIPTNSLCSFIGLNRTNLNKYMNVLIQDKIIQKDKRSVILLQPEKLKTYCSMRIINCQIVPAGMSEVVPAKYDFKQRILHDIFDYLSTHFVDQSEIEEYFSKIPVDYGYLNRLFKLQYDVTIRTFILERRLDFATELLLQTNKKIVDIAYESGFNSVSGFYRIFKENLGISPSEYRKHNV